MNNTDIISSKEILYLSVDKIKLNPFQPRKVFDKHSLEELALSIREFGIIQPICVRKVNHISYELVTGERRLRASKIAGLKEIPAILINVNDRDSAVIALIENNQRSALEFMEESNAFYNFMNNFDYTQKELAQLISKRISDVDKKVRVQRLDEEIKKELEYNKIGEEIAVALFNIDDKEKQLKLLRKIVSEGININKIDEVVNNIVDNDDFIDEDVKKKSNIKYIFKDINIFLNNIKKYVDFMNKYGIAACYSVEENDNEFEIKINIKMWDL